MLDNVVETLKRYWTLVYGRQWEDWQLLTMAAAVVVLLLVLIAIRRRRKSRAKRANVRTTAGQSEITDYERIKFFQQEIIKRDYAESRLEREVADLTADNEELRVKLAEMEAVSEQLLYEGRPDGKSLAQETAALKAEADKLRRQVEDGKHARECAEREIAELTTANKRLQKIVTEITDTNEQLRQEIEASETDSELAKQEIAELTALNEQLRSEAGQTDESSERELAELKAANETLARQVAEANKTAGHSRQEIAVLTAANSQLQEEINDLRSDIERLRKELEEGQDDSEEPKQDDANGLTAAREQRRRAAAQRKRTGDSKTGGRYQVEKSGLTWSVLERMVPHSQTGLKEKSPARQLKELAEEVVDLNVQMGGTEAHDAGKEAILHARDYLDADNAGMAVDALKKFVDSVQAQISDNGEALQKQEKEHLIAAAREIIDLLEAQ